VDAMLRISFSHMPDSSRMGDASRPGSAAFGHLFVRAVQTTTTNPTTTHR